MDLLDIVNCLLAFSILGAHLWSMHAHFDLDREKMPRGFLMLSIFVTVSAFFLAYLTWNHPKPLSAQLVGLVMMLASSVLFWITIRESSRANLLAVYDEKLPHTLLQTGPYSYVRHPFYTSYLILWTGWAIATWNVWSLIPLAGIIGAYWAAAVGEERKFLATPMAARYAEYKSRTGRFFPRFIGRT